ncbi:hypothetical protein [Lactobacillus crispatus]|uniref:hypothetical protein n=1 Tax=Lactobacillus crispatus TaxID=47770 RepID=UPI001ABD9EE0|nr:hypothetical protein [Lactobacillus crispatus]MBO4165902.1 hypothetical protein [Lactobacillus crispatus]
MVDKEEKEKLTEALKEYIGEDVGDIEYCYGEDLQEPGRRITIITKPHKPTFKEKRKELVDQLDKDLKEIDGVFGAKALDENNVRVYEESADIALFEIYEGNDSWDIRHIHLCNNIYLSVPKMIKIMNAISKFSKELDHLKELYKNETI